MEGVAASTFLDEVRRLLALRLLPPRLVRGFEAVQDWDWTPTDRIGIWLTALRTFVACEGHALIERARISYGCCEETVRPVEAKLALVSVLTCPACGAVA